MAPEMRDILLDWELPLWTTVALVLTAMIYLRGWILIRKTRPALFPVWRLVCFLGGLFSLFLATASHSIRSTRNCSRHTWGSTFSLCPSRLRSCGAGRL